LKFLLFPFFFISCLASAQSGISISHITGSFYRYTTWKTFNDKPPATVPANGMFVLTDSGALLIDTPFDTTQFQELLDNIETLHQKKVIFCLATHSHSDRTSGLEYYSSLGIPTYTSALTDSLCIASHEKRGEYHFLNDTTFRIGEVEFSTFYPGKGHAPDNMVVWFPEDKVLYGGCFVKSTESKDLGNLADADVKAWEVSMKRLMARYPEVKYVIPGHFGGITKKSLNHTLSLIRTEKSKQLQKKKKPGQK